MKRLTCNRCITYTGGDPSITFKKDGRGNYYNYA